MIASVTLTNFQSHQSTHIDFSDGVNAIIGFSDAGKSAIMRGLAWVITNKPSGADFTSHWGGETSVEIELTDGQTIKRLRHKDRNEYWLNDQCFKAFGQDVPAEIKLALNLSDVNLQFQMDGPFLLSDSPGDVAQYLNKVVKLDGIDRAISYVRKALGAAQQDLKVADAQLVAVNEQLEQLTYLEEFEADVVAVEALSKEQDSRRKQLAALQGYEDRLVEQGRKVREFSRIAAGDVLLAECLQLSTGIAANAKRRDTLQVLARDFAVNDGLLVRAERVLAAEPALTALLAEDKRIAELDRRAAALQTIRTRYATQSTGAVAAGADLVRLERLFADTMPDTCPLCGKS